MKKPILYLLTALILGLTLFAVPAVLGHQSSINPYVLTDNINFGNAYNVFLGVIVMLAAVGLLTALWLNLGFERPVRLSGIQYGIGLLSMLMIGIYSSLLTAWAYKIGLLDIDHLGFYAWNVAFYLPAMLATLTAALLVKRHVIRGNNGLAEWSRRNLRQAIPARASRPLPTARGVAALPARS